MPVLDIPGVWASLAASLLKRTEISGTLSSVQNVNGVSDSCLCTVSRAASRLIRRREDLRWSGNAASTFFDSGMSTMMNVLISSFSDD